MSIQLLLSNKFNNFNAHWNVQLSPDPRPRTTFLLNSRLVETCRQVSTCCPSRILAHSKLRTQYILHPIQNMSRIQILNISLNPNNLKLDKIPPFTVTSTSKITQTCRNKFRMSLPNFELLLYWKSPEIGTSKFVRFSSELNQLRSREQFSLVVNFWTYASVWQIVRRFTA